MSTFPCELEGPSLVLVGHFNPSIYQPSWLAKHALIRPEEEKTAQVELIAGEFARFSIGTLTLTIDRGSFSITTADPHSENVVRDLGLGVFRILEHTPVHAMGLNRDMHFRMPDKDACNRIGHSLAPKAAWEGVLQDPGMLSITIRGKREQSPAEYVQIKVEPSIRIEPGVYFHTNEHFQGSSESDSLPELLDALENQWEKAHRFARQSAEQMLGSLSQGASS